MTTRSETAWDTRAPTRPGQGLLVTSGLLCLVPAVGATWLRIVPPVDGTPALLASFIPYGLVFWLPASVLLVVAAVRARARKGFARTSLVLLSLLALVGLLATARWRLPAFLPDSKPATTSPMTIVSLNVEHGGADPSATAGQAVGADVVSFVEATPDWIASLPLSFREEFPYAVGAPLQNDVGSVVFARFPITSSEALPRSSFQQWAAVVDTPQVGALRVVAVHPCNPFCGPGLWPAEHTELRTWLDRQGGGPTVVAGDFNAVDDHGPMQQLYADGWRSAAELAGAGFVPTFPANRRIPPVIGIDHVLVGDRLTASAFSTFEVAGTDHLGVRAVLAGAAS